jgi:hypothetical protein
MATIENTFESVWAVMHENERIMKKRLARTERIMAEKQAETERIMKENHAETERIMTEKQAETDRALKELSEQLYDFKVDVAKTIKNWNKTLGKWDNSRGDFALHYFLNAFKHGRKTFFGEKFERVDNNLKGVVPDYIDEYDIVLINGKSIGIVEVKCQPHDNTIAKVLRKADTFRINFPYFANHKIFLGFASLVFPPDLEEQFTNQGIAVIKQIGKLVVIVDDKLKSF